MWGHHTGVLEMGQATLITSLSLMNPDRGLFPNDYLDRLRDPAETPR